MEHHELIAYTTSDFQKWLKKHHKKEKKVAVILYKRHTKNPAPTHRELMEEAICFGWIDTTIKRRDDDTYIRYFARRNNNSTWSDNTRSYAKQLIKDKRMTPEGMKYYKLGLKKKTHDHGIPKNPDMPEELKQELLKKKNKKAKQQFDTYPPSTRKMLYRWILSGKQDATRTKRIKKIIELAKEGRKDFF